MAGASSIAVGVSALLAWSFMPASEVRGDGSVVLFLETADKGDAVGVLETAGFVQRPLVMRLYLTLLLPNVELIPGEHLLEAGLSPREIAQRLARLPGRAVERVVLPEGWHRKKLAERLETQGICRARPFLEATANAELLRELEIPALTAEGYLFPATYEVAVDSAPEAVVRRLVRETQKRLKALEREHPFAMSRLEKEYGFGRHDVLTLASIVERETAHAEERPLIARVFLNRLRDESGQTRGRLQSDPTAAYGCEYEPQLASSCRAYRGKVLPEMLRDPDNRYNTYRRAGLPPGPIANPGRAALEAVLEPAQGDYLFFVADGAGRHTFTRSFDEHRMAVERLRGVRGTPGQEALDDPVAGPEDAPQSP